MQAWSDFETSTLQTISPKIIAGDTDYLSKWIAYLKGGGNEIGSVCDLRGQTALHLACLFGVESVVQLLLDHQADVSVADQGGFTPLHLCASEDHVECVRLLLDAGASMRSNKESNESGLTLLHLCASEDHVECARLLLDAGASMSAQTSDDRLKVGGFIDVWQCGGRTPLHCAAHRGSKDAAALLVERGASEDAEDHNGNTPVDLAILGNRSELLPLFSKSSEVPSKHELKLRRAKDEKATRLRIEQSERDFQISQIDAIKEKYTPLHPDVYETKWSDWIQPELLDALEKASCGNETPLRNLVRETVKGVLIFPCLRPEVCRKLWEELDHYEREAERLGLPLIWPHGKTKKEFDVTLGQIGFEKIFEEIKTRVITRMANTFLEKTVSASPFSTKSDSSSREWCFGSLRAFYLTRKPENDAKRSTHVDPSDMTFNVCLGKDFTGSRVYFHQLRGSPLDREKEGEHVSPHPDLDSGECEHCSLIVEHKIGVAIIHRGDFIHGTEELKSGLRGNLVVWCTNDSSGGSCQDRENQHVA